MIAQAPTPSVAVTANDSTGDGPRIVPKPASNLAPGMVKSAVEDHPVSSQRSDADQAVQAPSLDAASADDSSNAGALSGIVSSNVAAPAAPEIQPEGPVKVGGNVKEPRLVSRVMPEYPLVAKQANIQGDVVVKTTIDPKGNVVNMQSRVRSRNVARRRAGSPAPLEIRAFYPERPADRRANAGYHKVQRQPLTAISLTRAKPSTFRFTHRF